jgi:hypothetical protein
VTDLTATRPVLAYDGVATGYAALEQPINVRVAHVVSDGEEVAPDSLATAGYFLYRRPSAGAALDIWDDGEKLWTSELDTTVHRTPFQLAYQPDDPEAWHGIIVAAGGRDLAGNPQFAKAIGGYPLYAVRAFFVSSDRSDAVLTGPSANVAFVSTSDKNLVVMGPGEGEQLAAATEARVLLKDPSLQAVGALHIERSALSAAVTLVNSAGASIVLQPDGSIELTPATGQRVVVAGDLETDHITYLPAGSAVKQTLV